MAAAEFFGAFARPATSRSPSRASRPASASSSAAYNGGMAEVRPILFLTLVVSLAWYLVGAAEPTPR